MKQRRPALPVFMISADGENDTIQTARQLGVDRFLTKPVDFQKL